MTRPGRAPRRERGLSLVELMIATVVGILVIGGIVTVFSGSRRTAELNRTMTELQEGARFALESMVRDVRMAGFQGCVSIAEKPATLRGDALPTSDFAATAFTAARVDTASSWSPELPGNFVPPAAGTRGAPVPGTHAVSVQFGNPSTHRIDPMLQVDDDVVLAETTAEAAGFGSGGYALVSDCEVADVFRISATNGAALRHDGAVNGGDPRLSAPYGAGGEGTRPRVMRFEANVYWVGDTGRTNAAGDAVTSLFRQTLPYGTSGNPPIEMVEGVANLKVRVGLRQTGDVLAAERLTFVPPEDSAAAGFLPASVEIGLLVQSHDRVADAPDARTYRLAGTTLSPGTAGAATAYAADRRLRLAFNTTVSIRNRR